MSTICEHGNYVGDDEACGRCQRAERNEVTTLFNSARRIAELVDVENNFAVIVDAHQFVEEIKRLKELTHV